MPSYLNFEYEKTFVSRGEIILISYTASFSITFIKQINSLLLKIPLYHKWLRLPAITKENNVLWKKTTKFISVCIQLRKFVCKRRVCLYDYRRLGRIDVAYSVTVRRMSKWQTEVTASLRYRPTTVSQHERKQQPCHYAKFPVYTRAHRRVISSLCLLTESRESVDSVTTLTMAERTRSQADGARAKKRRNIGERVKAMSTRMYISSTNGRSEWQLK